MNTNRIALPRIPSFVALALGIIAVPSANAGLPLQPEQIVVTCFSGTINYYSSPPTVTPNLNNNGYVVAQYDTTTGNIGPLIPNTSSPPELWDVTDTPPLASFHNATGQPWNAQRLGEVFGICVDDASSPNIYVTATECYNIVGSATPLPKGPGGPGGIYKLDGTTGNSTFGSLPNNSGNGPGLGNVCFRRAGSGTGYLYVSDLEDGKIYRMDAATLTTVGTPYDHGVTGRTTASLSTITDDGTPGLTQLGRRVWGVKTYQSKLYYAVWWEDSRNISLTESNEIWSVGLDNNGDFVPNSAQRLISLPDFTINQWSHPVASIDFSPSGNMYLAERYWQYLAMVPNATFGAHHARILRYTLSGPNWVTTPTTTHHIGGDASFYFPNTQNGANSAGGVAANCDDSIWATGDMWNGSYTPYINGYVYGTLRIPTGGNSMYAGNGYGCLAIDYDGNIAAISKFGVGAIATVRDCCLPPPSGMVAWWPLDESTGAPTYADLSGNGNTALVQSGGPVGSFNSPSAIPGKVAGGGSFLDSNTRGRAPNAPSLNFGTNNFALDCWVRPVAISPTAWQTIVDKFDTNTLRGYTVGISNGTVVLRVGDGTTYTRIGPAITYGVWNFIGVNVNRAANNVRFYVNGVGTGPQALAASGSFNNTLDLLIGAPYEPNVVSETALDEIELFNRVLTTNELSDLWLSDALGKCKSGQPPCSNSVVSIVCPTNMTVACAPIVFYPPPQAATTCGTITNITCTPPSGSNFPVGTNLVTCTAQDSLGNSNSCTFTITVTPDNVPPVLDCQCLTNSFHEQLNIVGCVGLVPSLCQYHQCFSDNCGLANCSQTPPAGTPVGPGVTPITITIWDFAGNSNSCVVLMTVTAPPGGCAGPCAPSWKFLSLAITNISGVTNGIFTGANGTIKATTSGGPFMGMNNSAYASQFPVLFGSSGTVTGFVAQAQLGATYSATFDLSSYVIQPGTVFGIWNITEESNTYKIQVFDCASNLIAPPFGSGTFSFMGWDDDLLSGNIGWQHMTLNPATGLLATSPFTSPNTDCDAAFWTNLPPNACRIVVTGNNLPDSDGVVFYFAEPQPCCEIICPTNITVYSCGTNVVVYYPAPTLTNCVSGSVVTCVPPSGSSFPPGTNTVTCSVIDPIGGTTDSCTFKVIVTTPPGGCGQPCQILCPTDIIVTTCGTNAVVYYPPPFTENCGTEPTIICTPPSGSTFPLGTNTVTCIVLDGSGGVAALCEFKVIVLQSPSLQPWTVICPPIPASINVTGCPPVMPNLSGLITIVTNCTLQCPPIITQSILPGTPLTAGSHAVTVNICDCLTNCSICVITVNAYATGGNPTITCPPNQVVTTCGTNAVVKFKVKGTGHTGPITCTPPSGSTFPLGITLVTCTATNACGGISTCSFTVTVKQPLTRWPCDWQVGIGIPYRAVGGADTALMAVAPGGPGYPAVCVFPNPANTHSGILLKLEQAGILTFTTELDFTAPEGSGMDLVLPPSSMNTNDTPILSFRHKGAKGYCIKANKRFADDPAGTYRCIAVNTNGNLLDSFTFEASETATNEPFILNRQPGVTNCHVTVELNLRDGSVSVEFDGPVVFNSARKGWDGCIYGPDRPVKKPKATARVIFTPSVSPGESPISEINLFASGIPEFRIEEPTLASVAKPRRGWSDGHVTLIKVYDEAGSTEFAASGPNSVVQVDVGHAESFNLRWLRLETNTIPGEEILTRTVGMISGLTTQPEYLDAMLLKENSGSVECSVDFSNLGAVRVDIHLLNSGILIATGSVTGPVIAPNDPLVIDHWPQQLGHLPASGAIRLLSGAPFTIEGFVCNEVHLIPVLPPGAAHPDYYSAFQFLPSEGGDWAVEDLTTTSICVAQPVAIHEAGGNVTVTWTGEIFRLQGAEQITGPWYDLGKASPLTVPAASKARFFRLVCD